MQKRIGNMIFWGSAMAGSIGASYAAHEIIEQKIVEPRASFLHEQEASLQNCTESLAVKGIGPGFTPELPPACMKFAEDWTESDVAMSGTTSIVGFIVPPYSRLAAEQYEIVDDRASIEKVSVPLAAVAGAAALLLAYGVKSNYEEFRKY